LTVPCDPAAPNSGLPGADEALCLGPERADHRLVLLHGWGADADDLLDLGLELLGEPGEEVSAALGRLSLVSLRAPLPHPGGSGRQWYDLLPAPAWDQLPEARAALRRRLLQLAASVPLERTAVLGFSQGAAMALDVVTGSGERQSTGAGEGPLPVAALIACSGYPHPDWRPGHSTTRVLLTHGDQDPMVAPAASLEVERALQARSNEVETQAVGVSPGVSPGEAAAEGAGKAAGHAAGTVQRLTFPGGHGIDPALLPTLRAFLEESWAG
jgi:phospholipase/carboxylesterase